METALVALTDDLRRQLDLGGSALLILLDLTAAFDIVNHGLLARCVADVGIQGLALDWLRSFLQGRGQRVALGESISERRALNCGVPQGAILSPMLFNIYIRPLAQLVQSFGWVAINMRMTPSCSCYWAATRPHTPTVWPVVWGPWWIGSSGVG